MEALRAGLPEGLNGFPVISCEARQQFVELYGGEKEWDAASAPDGAAEKAAKEKVAAEAAAWDIVPCDCVIVRGDAIVSEASLTGESAPQMKDAIVVEDRALDMQGPDRVHSLFSGTKLLRSSEGSARKAGSVACGAEGAPKVPKTPEGGCLCFVVCTGFSSSQGELLQMIEFSQEGKGECPETRRRPSWLCWSCSRLRWWPPGTC
ncbi:unnamed protein product [Prorocentrum cordatum]|uniref:P-type ATPase A domain-containing protein n=1 Tax=Prorocentrum cordatum TaxID=2364126 RepID=A0ABN9WP25_9DINO|nr:unnamed protein product [Polarella glacialis]